MSLKRDIQGGQAILSLSANCHRIMFAVLACAVYPEPLRDGLPGSLGQRRYRGHPARASSRWELPHLAPHLGCRGSHPETMVEQQCVRPV